MPQSIQSRGQFGFYGAAFMFPAVLLLNVGFIAAELVIQAQAMNGVTAALSIPAWIVILAVPSVVIGIFGYRWIHWVMQATAVVVGVSLVIMLIQGLRHGALPAHETTLARPHLRPVPGRGRAAGHRHAVVRPVRVRLHPVPARADERDGGCSGRIYAGNVLATFFSCAVGAYLAALLPSLGPVAAIGKVSGRVGAGHHGRVADQREHLQRLHRVVPGAGLRQHVAAVQGRVGDRPADPVRVP